MSARAGRRSPEFMDTVKACLCSGELVEEISSILNDGDDAKLSAEKDGTVKLNRVSVGGVKRFTGKSK